MTPDKARLLNNLRLEIARRQEYLDKFHGGALTNERGEDVAPEFVGWLQQEIERLTALVDEHDPEGMTTLG